MNDSSDSQPASSAQQDSTVASPAESASQPGSRSGSKAAIAAEKVASTAASTTESASQSASQAASQAESHPTVQSASRAVAEAASSAQSSASEQLTKLQSTLAQAIGSGKAQTSSAPERAKQALLQRTGMVSDRFREDDCTCFDTTLGCLLTVSQRRSCTIVLLVVSVKSLTPPMLL